MSVEIDIITAARSALKKAKVRPEKGEGFCLKPNNNIPLSFYLTMIRLARPWEGGSNWRVYLTKRK